MWPASSASTLQELKTFYQVPAEAWDAFQTATGPMPEDFKALAALPAAVVAAAVSDARTSNGDRLTVIQASQVGLVYRAARRLLYVQGGGNPETWIDPNPWEASSSTTAPTTSLSTTATSSTEVKMKFTHILDQADETEFPVVSESTKAAWVQRYIDATGGLPCEESEPTKEQLSALHRKIHQLGSPPYADFAVFTPFGRKMFRATRYRTYIPNLDGTFLMREVPGPTNYTQWLASYRVWKVAMVMLDCIPIALLQQYEVHVERLVKLYNGCWHLVVSADDKARSDHLARLQMKISLDFQAGRPVPVGWDSKGPSWAPVFRLLLDDHNFWAENVRNPALVWMAHGSRGPPRTPSEQVAALELHGGEQAIKVDKEQVQSQPGSTTPTRKQQANRDRREARKKRLKADREELSKFRNDRGSGSKGKGKGRGEGGEQLCYSWNNGNPPCGGLPPGAACQGRVQRVHKCTSCGSPGHPSKQCTAKEDGK